MERRDVLKLAAATALVGVPTVAAATPKREPWEDGAAVVVTFRVNRMHPLDMAEKLQHLTDEAMADNPGWAFKETTRESTDWWSELVLEIEDLDRGVVVEDMSKPATTWRASGKDCVSLVCTWGGTCSWGLTYGTRFGRFPVNQGSDVTALMVASPYNVWKSFVPNRRVISATVTHFVYRQDPNAPRFETRQERARRPSPATRA